ncbi:hypothetical protein GY12_00950 [Micrococcus luteus]|nr:hypothetical protein GY12_19780 [Micrococcus luteus]KFC52749.1 hypothetical protein GY12_00950 [Micrococcus luteus]
MTVTDAPTTDRPTEFTNMSAALRFHLGRIDRLRADLAQLRAEVDQLRTQADAANRRYREADRATGGLA